MSHWRTFGIPNVSVTQEQVDARLQCSICLEDYGLRDEVLKLNCGHCFHEACLGPWLNQNNICPTCRSRAIRSCVSLSPSPEGSTIDLTLDFENLANQIANSDSITSLTMALESNSDESYLTDTVSIHAEESMSEESADEEDCESDDSISDLSAVLEFMEEDDLPIDEFDDGIESDESAVEADESAIESDESDGELGAMSDNSLFSNSEELVTDDENVLENEP